MSIIQIRPSHFTYHREGPAPRLRLQSDVTTGYVHIEFVASPHLLLPDKVSQRSPENYFSSWAGQGSVAGTQLQLAEGALTYHLPPAIWRQMRNHHHIYYRAAVATQLPSSWTEAGAIAAQSVHPGQVARGYLPYFGVPHDRLGEPWTFPDAQPLAQLPIFYREKLRLLMRYHETHEDAYLLRRLAGHDTYTALPTQQRMQALYIFSATNRPARRALLHLFDRIIPETTATGASKSAVLDADLSRDRLTLLDNLARLVEVDPHMDIHETMDTLIEDVIEEVSNPHYELNQGTKGTCAPTSVQWIVTTYFPSEYVRLLRELLSQAGRTVLANGHTATVPSDTHRYDSGEESPHIQRFLRRSWSERVFQAAMMNYARPGLTYSNLNDIFSDQRGGLTSPELVRLLSGLRNRAYTIHQGNGANVVSAIAQQLAAKSLPLVTAMLWGPTTNQGGHAVVSVRSDHNNIVFRNPWGRVNYQVGQALQNPMRSATNPSRGEETIATSTLANWVMDVLLEQA